MTPPLLATGRRAAEAYVFSRLLIQIWSYEELCYLFKTNPYILDAAIIDRKLVNWLGTSCDLGELAAALNVLLKKKAGTREFVNCIIEYGAYLNADERALINEVLVEDNAALSYEREISCADFLHKSGKHQLALQEYERILLSLPQGERALSAGVLHKRGVCLAHLFMFEQSAASFLSAYERNGSADSGRAYLMSIRLSMGDVEYIRFIAERPSLHDFSLEIEHIYIQAMNDYNETDEKHAIDEAAADPGRLLGMIALALQEYRDNIGIIP